MFEAFAGIGAQHKAISNIKNKLFQYKIIKTSEWDARTIISYALIHNSKKFNTKLKEIASWKEEQINKYILSKSFSLNSKNLSRNIKGKSLEFKQILIAANESNNNIEDIKKVRGSDINNIDLLTYSFPCQGLSIANMGRDKGISISNDSTSNLIWDIWRILKESKDLNNNLPKYLLMENVRNLLGKKHIGDYEEWTKGLESLGYKTYTIKLNGLDFGSVQRRVRIFGISILNDKNNWNKEDILKIVRTLGKRLNKKQREIKYLNILNSSNKNVDEILSAIPNNTPSRIRMARDNADLLKEAERKEYIFNTLTTKQDRHPNLGMIDVDINIQKYGKLPKRFITPREAYQIMGFESSDYDKVIKYYRNVLITKESLYRQAGNSIVVGKLEAILKFISNYERGIYQN